MIINIPLSHALPNLRDTPKPPKISQPSHHLLLSIMYHNLTNCNNLLASRSLYPKVIHITPVNPKIHLPSIHTHYPNRASQLQRLLHFTEHIFHPISIRSLNPFKNKLLSNLPTRNISVLGSVNGIAGHIST